MKILQFGDNDLIGTRFNGQDLHQTFLKIGMDSKHIVWEKRGEDALTYQLIKSKFIKDLVKSINGTENKWSIQSLLSPVPLSLLGKRYFWAADLIHYHIIHSGYFSLFALPLLSRLRPFVWTIHDPWAFTGHCVYPIECTKWQTGCGGCPDLARHISMRKDRSAFMWKTKKNIYHNSKLDIIVASKYMQGLVANSPLFEKARVHHVPFGLDLNKFQPASNAAIAEKRKKLGIKPGHLVISFRADTGMFKGFSFIKEALAKINTTIPLTLLTFSSQGLCDEFIGKHQIIELGWVEDLQQTIDAYQVSDIFLMPSIAEAFGMMAMEAMACGKPTIVFEGTSLPEVVFAPEGGIPVPRNSEALAAALMDLVNNQNKREAIGRRAREIAVEHYDFNTHVERILAIYQKALQR